MNFINEIPRSGLKDHWKMKDYYRSFVKDRYF